MASRKKSGAPVAVPGIGDPNRSWSSWIGDCSHCGGKLFPLKLFEMGARAEQREVEFGSLAAVPENTWTQGPKVPVLGVVRGGACERCSRIQMFAVRYDEEA